MLHLQTIEALGNDQFISVDAANACNDFALCADYKETLKKKRALQSSVATWKESLLYFHL